MIFENFIIEYVSYSTLQLCVEISCYEINMLKMDKVNIKFTNLHFWQKIRFWCTCISFGYFKLIKNVD